MTTTKQPNHDKEWVWDSLQISIRIYGARKQLQGLHKTVGHFIHLNLL